MAVIRLRVSGRAHRVDVPPGEPLLTVLRAELDLSRARYGSGGGHYGAGTALVDGPAALSGVSPTGPVEGKAVTIEGLVAPDSLHPVRIPLP